MSLTESLSKARTRLIEFRLNESSESISVHINSIEIAICLTEFSLKTTPTRPISNEEEQWFRAGKYVDLIIGNSEWSDIADHYFNIVEEVKKRNFFR